MQIVDRYFGKIAWILTGICFAAAVSLMIVSGTFNLDCFYDVGEVYDVLGSNLVLSGNGGLSYNSEEQVFTVDSELAEKGIVVSNGKWQYIYLSLSKVSEGNFDASVVCYNDENTLVYQMETILSEGDNLLTIPEIKYKSFFIIVRNHIGLSFEIEKVQLRENQPIFSKRRFMTWFLVLFILFLFTTGIVLLWLKRKKHRISWYTLMHGMQTVFLYIGKYGQNLSIRYSSRKRSLIRRWLFCFIFLFMQVSFILNYYFNKQTYRFLVLVCVLVILMIAFLCWEKPLKYLDWNNKLVAAWLGLWSLAIISNFVVEKNFGYAGFSMLFAVGFFFFMWGNLKQREVLLRDFICGIEWSFLPNLLFCYLCRPYNPEYRYMGSTYSPGIFGLYLLFVWIAFLSELDFNIKNRKSLRYDLFFIFMLGICGNLLWKTQSVSSILPAALAALIFSFKFWNNRKQLRILGFVLYLLIFSVGYVADSYCIYYVPRQIDIEIKFKKDVYKYSVKENPLIVSVQAADAEGINRNSILYKLTASASLEKLTTGRTLFWKAYLREINLWGHKGNAKFLGGTHMPHNGFIAIMYRYGIFAIVPYLLMVLYNLLYAYRYFRKHLFETKGAFFILTDVLCCTLLLFPENLELPFGWVCWYGMYIVMGIYFDDEKSIE